MKNKRFDKKVRYLAQNEAFIANERIITTLRQHIRTEQRSTQYATKEAPVKKRKVSFVLVCVLTLILLAGVAFAIGTHFRLFEYFGQEWGVEIPKAAQDILEQSKP